MVSARVRVDDDDPVVVMTETVRVLIVDDQEPFRAAARMAVELTDGFDVVAESGSGQEALDAFRTLAPDLVLMDVQMPGMDGLEATRQLLEIDAAARVIVLSTYSADEFEQRALDAGAIAFVSKSDFTPDALSQVWSRAG